MKKKKKNGGVKRASGRSKVHEEAIQRVFKGMPVRDARADLILIPNKHDVDTAIKGNPLCCVLANAAKRVYGSKTPLFFKAIAYVDLVDENGERAVYRFRLYPNTRRKVERFDKTGKFPADGFCLRAPKGTMTLEANRAAQVEWRRRRRQALLKGESISSGGRGRGKKDTVLTVAGDVTRDGTGMVQFLRNHPEVVERVSA